MLLKKKKYIILLTIWVAVCFILYQLYFFLTITSEVNNINSNRIVPLFEHSEIKEYKHLRSDADKNINDNGVIKGVLLTNMPRYRPDNNNEFKCLLSQQHIPFDQVNDDYCDCDDGTDEPSTSACVNGTFYCDTQYQNKPTSLNSVPSGKVNDGICDCCDGSDEWLHSPNTKLLTQVSSKMQRHYSDKCLNICYN